jgi:hypothetical protein
MAGITDYLPLMAKLLARTKDRKIEWKGTYDSSTFICALEGQYSFEIEKDKTSAGTWYRKLTMKDKEQEEVFVARAVSPTNDTSRENDELYQTLDNLHEHARRVALDIDRKVSDVNNILDKI